MKFIFLTLICFAYEMNCQSDGNPHKWDRKRRCDNEDYDPPCGICEGIGGIVWSDKQKDITITKCEKVALPEELTKEERDNKPKFDLSWVNERYFQILISDKYKNNPFCIGTFPGPDSTKNHCYQVSEGIHYYDWENYQLREDLNIYGKLGNTTSTIYHKRNNMWIDSHMPLGIKNCVCANPGKTIGVDLYPINPNFMEKDSRFIGREKLFIEYLGYERIVDHWIKGPHHIWNDVKTNKIIRLWQPWNGLQVFDPDRWTDFPSKEFKDRIFELPPQRCLNGWFKINCDKDGLPKSSPPSDLFEKNFSEFVAKNKILKDAQE